MMNTLLDELLTRPGNDLEKCLITIIADNFSLSEDNALFVRKTLEDLNFTSRPLSLIQIGFIQNALSGFLDKKCWNSTTYQYLEPDVHTICEKINKDLSGTKGANIVFNDVSKLELLASDSSQSRDILLTAEGLRKKGNNVIFLYQNSLPSSTSNFLRNIEYLSHALIRAKFCKPGYFISTWSQPNPQRYLSIPSCCIAKVETHYYTFDIAIPNDTSRPLEYIRVKEVSKNYNPDEKDDLELASVDPKTGEEDGYISSPHSETSGEEIQQQTPYTSAQNTEEFKIFYYPDKNDDIDEEDPDNDLNF